MTMTDIKEKVVDCNIAIAMGVSGIIFAGVYNGWLGIGLSFLGMIIGALSMELAARLGYLFAKTRAMGEADTYVAGALGAVFGVYGVYAVFVLLILSLIASMIFIIPVFFYNKYKIGDKKTLISAIWFTLSVVLFRFGVQNYLTFALLLVTGICLAYFLLKGMRSEESRTYFPYVPALAIAGAYFIFFIGIGII
jgi:hypothetical protein